MTRVAIFASGKGTNAREILTHFKSHDKVQVALLLTGSAASGAAKVATAFGCPVVVVDKQTTDAGKLLALLQEYKIDFVVLAGWLRLIPSEIVKAFPKRIINIHPALLPKYGGKGMYGDKVHQAVAASGDKESGVTIHFVNEQYDEGDIIAQYKTRLQVPAEAATIARAVQQLEHRYFPAVIEALLLGKPIPKGLK